jgi:hypothetical protein
VSIDRYWLALAWLAGGERAVYGELFDAPATQVYAELAARAAQDGRAASQAGGGDVASAVRALAAQTGARSRGNRASAAPQRRGPYTPAPAGQVVDAIIALRAAGTSLPVIVEKTGVNYCAVRSAIARHESRTGRPVAPDKVTGRDGKSRSARRASA